MSRFFNRISAKAGLPPGTVVHIGEDTSEEMRITVMDYDSDHLEEGTLKDIPDCFPYRDTATVTWINVEGLGNTKVIEEIGSHYGFHPLHIEDIVNTNGRPKIEEGEGYVMVILKMLYLWGDEHEAVSEHVSIFLGKNYVISFQEEAGDVFDNIRKAIRSGKGKVRKEGPDYLAYLLMDSIVDNYFAVIEDLGELIEDTEEIVLNNPGRDTMHRIHVIKNEILFLRKAILPLREVASDLKRGDTDLISRTTEVHMRDVYDHIIQVMDFLDLYRDLISGMLDTYMTGISNRMNEIMKFLTIFSTIFIPLTFLAGIYGMNFDSLPGRQWDWSYLVFCIVCVIIGALMLIMYKKKRWI